MEKNSYIKVVFKSLGLIFKTDPRKTSCLFLLLTLQVLIPIVEANSIASFIDNIKNLDSLYSAITLILPFILAVLVDFIVGPTMMIVQGELTDGLVKTVNMKLFNKLGEINNLKILESATFYDRLNMLQMEISYQPINLIVFSFSIIRIVATIFFMFAQLFSYSWIIPLLFLIGIFPQSYLVYKLQEVAFENTVDRSPFVKELDYYRSIIIGRDFSKERVVFKYVDKFKEYYRNIIDKINKESQVDRRKKGMMSIYVSLLGVFIIAFAIIYFLNKVIVGIFTIGTFSLFLNYLIFTAKNSVEFMQEGSLLLQTEQFMKIYFEFLDTDFNVKSGVEKLEIIDSIEFKNVSFKYPSREDYALKNVSFKFNSGEKLGIVGVNGSGKSTVMKLILRLYDVDEGEVLINGLNIKEYSISDLRKRFSVLFQDFNKYEVSLKDNILLGDIKKESDDILYSSINLSGTDKVISKLKNGLLSKLGKIHDDAVLLSGGEWQRIGVARAFYRDGNVVLFDEPTSALDPIQEKIFWENILNDLNTKSAIFTTHRIQGLKRASRFIVLKNGKLVEEGSFDKLMDKRGEFYELFTV